MLVDPYASQEHACIKRAVFSLQQEVTRPKARFREFLATNYGGKCLNTSLTAFDNNLSTGTTVKATDHDMLAPD